jgi:hypothetical protein
MTYYDIFYSELILNLRRSQRCRRHTELLVKLEWPVFVGSTMDNESCSHLAKDKNTCAWLN